MRQALLEDRGVVEVGGADAGALLQRLLTNDVLGLAGGAARYAALLTPQGKIVVDFFALAEDREGERRFLLDCPRALAPDLARKLTLYRLRASVTIADRSPDLAVAASWPEPPRTDGPAFKDPRHADLGWRAIVPRAAVRRDEDAEDAAAYARHRLALGVPEGGRDFAYGDTFPHDANLDRLRGIDFAKGCYVGQEVVSRVEHRGTARRRILPVRFEGKPPPPGTALTAGDVAIGAMGSGVSGLGLASLRVDRAAEAAAAGVPVMAGGIPVSVVLG